MENLSKHKSFYLLAFLTGVLSLFALNQPVAASENGSQAITLSPSSTDIKIEPGATIERSFKVLNTGKDSFSVTTTVSPYRVEGTNYDPKFTQLPGTRSPLEWVSMEQSNAVLKSGTSETFKYKISVPKTTAPGGYYVVLFAETSPIDVKSGGVVPHNRVGNILYINVKGPVNNSGSLNESSVSPISVSDSVPIGVNVKNTGGVHFVSKVEFDVKSLAGKQAYQATLERYVLPQTERHIETTWKVSAPIGLYTVERRATVANQEKTLPAIRILIIKPWFFNLIVLLLVLIIAYVVVRRTQRNGKKPQRNVR